MNSVVWTALTLFVVAIGVLGIYVHSGNGHLTPVLTGSMRPGIEPGDVVVTKKVSVGSLHVNDIVVFTPPGQTLARVHRIASLRPLGNGSIAVTTKGDNNAAVDPWGTIIMKGSTYKAQLTLPKVGWFVANGGLRWLITGFVFLAAIMVAAWTWRYVRSDSSDMEVSDTEPSSVGSPPNEDVATKVA